jgi:hypothetical protein
MGIIFENGFNLGSTNFAVSPTPTPSPSSSAGAPPSPTPTATVTPTQSSMAASPTPTPSPSVGSNAGVGSWYFYSDEGTINVGPPISNGNALFTIQGSPILETYNPNENSGTSFLYFALNDNTGTNYGTQFSGLTPGGTISIIQNNKKATYTGGSNSFMVVNDGLGNFFFMINTGVATQAVNASSSFVFGDPISITFGS